MESITVVLSSGSITLQVDADFLSMSPDDFAFVAGLAQAMRARAEGSSPVPEEEADGTGEDDDEPEVEASKVWTCEPCGREFASPQGLGAHRRHVHPVTRERIAEGLAREAASRVATPEPTAEVRPIRPVDDAPAVDVDGDPIDLDEIVATARETPHGTAVWRYVADALDLSEANARDAVIRAKRLGRISRTDREIWGGDVG